MIDVSPAIAILIMFGSLILLLAMGLHVAFALGGIGVMSILLLWGPQALSVVVHSAWAVMISYTLVAVPLFIFMAMILRASGIAEDLFMSMRLWLGRVPGGMAIGVVFVCTVVAAMSGVTMTGVVTMGVLALPLMLRLGYNKTIALGPILAGGALGVLIPPSVTFVFYGAVTMVSVGKLFLGGVIPGLMLAFLYASYIGVRCYIKPELGPPLPPEERLGFKEKVLSLKSGFLPALLIMAVLGTIFLGICSPTEAASAGAGGAIVCAALHRRLSWKMIKEAGYETFKTTVMVMWIMIGAYCFKGVVIGVGGPALIRELLGGLGVAPIFIIALMSASFIVLGCFINEWTVLLITVPVYLPIVMSFGYDPIWFGVFFLVNMQIGYLTPPFGYTLFVLRGVAPPEVTMGDIIRSILPFIPLQLIVVILLMLFPQIALWLPNVVFG